MAVTSTITALQAEIWAKELYEDVQDEMFFESNGFIGKGADSIIQKNTVLTKNKGDTIHFGLTTKLSGSGVTGDNTLEGNEEAISSYEMPVAVAQKRNAVRLEGEEDEQKVTYNMRADAKSKLKTWMSEMIQDEMFETFGTSPSTNRKLFCSATNSSVGTLDNTDIVTSGYLGTAKRMAQLASPKIRPIKYKGKPYYVVVLHPFCFRDLKAEANSPIMAALNNAWWRGSDNPLFTGAEVVWDGLIIYEHPSVYTATDGASSANVARNLLLGQQAGCYAIAKEPYWREKPFDYGNSYGVATGLIYGFKKTVFNSEDYGTICMYASAEQD